MRIIRHPIHITDYQAVDLPAAGELLSVAASLTAPDYEIDLWSLDYERGDPRQVGVYVIGTGHPMPEQLRNVYPDAFREFVGTVVTPSGLVWHLFQGPLMEAS